MVKGLANAHGAAIVANRADRPFVSVDDLWRRAAVPSAALVELAEHAYVLETGRIVLDGPAAEIGADEGVRKSYLGY